MYSPEKQIRWLRCLAAAVLFASVGLGAGAASFREELRRADDHLHVGNATEALEIYHELQVDYPESEEVLYGTGCALYVQGEDHREVNEFDTAVKSFQEAQAAFERLHGTDDEGSRALGAFSRANCLASVAKAVAPDPEAPNAMMQMPPGANPAAPSQPQDQYEQGVAAYREAVSAYDAVLKEFPGHAGAKQNLDHVRYLLKKLLQNPPEKQEQEPPPDENRVSVFMGVGTDIAGADARKEGDDNVVRLVRPGAKGVK